MTDWTFCKLCSDYTDVDGENFCNACDILSSDEDKQEALTRYNDSAPLN